MWDHAVHLIASYLSWSALQFYPAYPKHPVHPDSDYFYPIHPDPNARATKNAAETDLLAEPDTYARGGRLPGEPREQILCR